MIALLAAAGFVVGAALPWMISRIPDRQPVDGDPPVTPYRELATAHGLPVLLGAGTAATWALLALAGAELGLALPAFLLVGALGVAMAYIDIREHRLPDWLTFPALIGAAAALAVAAGRTGDWSAYGRAWIGAAAAAGFYLVLVLLRPSDLGLGDVKLAAVIGLLLGWISWSVLIFGVFSAFVVGAVLGLALILSGRAGRRSAIPFGPPMLAGMLLAAIWGQTIVDAYLAL